jgi:REP element-mobilizing transposase RayT
MQILERLLPSIARQERAVVVELGVVRTHVHVLLKLDPTTSIPRLLQRLKGGSSVIVNRERGSTARGALRWAKGYNIDSISPRAVPAVRAYVRDQALRHPQEAIAPLKNDG